MKLPKHIIQAVMVGIGTGMMNASCSSEADKNTDYATIKEQFREATQDSLNKEEYLFPPAIPEFPPKRRSSFHCMACGMG